MKYARGSTHGTALGLQAPGGNDFYRIQIDAKADDRLFWFTTTGWMMWNALVSGLLTPASIVLYDGNPGSPDMGVLWELAEASGITTMGVGAAYIHACMKSGVEPRDGRELSRTDAATMLWERARMGDVGLVAVERPDGTVLGLVSERQLWRVRDGVMTTTSLASVATPIERFGRAEPGEPLVRALTRLHPLHPMLTVWDGGRLIGVVTPQAVDRRLDDRHAALV